MRMHYDLFGPYDWSWRHSQSKSGNSITGLKRRSINGMVTDNMKQVMDKKVLNSEVKINPFQIL